LLGGRGGGRGEKPAEAVERPGPGGRAGGGPGPVGLRQGGDDLPRLDHRVAAARPPAQRQRRRRRVRHGGRRRRRGPSAGGGAQEGGDGGRAQQGCLVVEHDVGATTAPQRGRAAALVPGGVREGRRRVGHRTAAAAPEAERVGRRERLGQEAVPDRRPILSEINKCYGFACKIARASEIC
jgi:hypothetical protein